MVKATSARVHNTVRRISFKSQILLRLLHQTGLNFSYFYSTPSLIHFSNSSISQFQKIRNKLRLEKRREEKEVKQRITLEKKKKMAVSENQESLTEEVSGQKGGLKTLPFIIVNDCSEKLASYGLLLSMILYLINGYHMDTATGTSALSLWFSLSSFLSICGAFVSDSFFGRFRVILFGSICSFLGLVLLWLTAMVPQAKPAPCDPSSNSTCKPSTFSQLAILFSSFTLMSLGAGCIRPCSMAFGADQLVKGEHNSSKNEITLQSFFNWYYASGGIATILSLTVFVYIQDHFGWKVGFGFIAILMFFSALLFLAGSPLYVKGAANNSAFTEPCQVLVASLRRRDLDFPPDNFEGFCYHHNEESKFIAPSNQLRFLNKACIIRDPEEELNPDGSASKPWQLCTIDQVEALKSLIRMIPIWSTGIIIYLDLGQSSILVIQAKSMNRHITSNFEIPPASFTLFVVVSLTIWITFYDRVIGPILTKHTRIGRLSPMTRMGIGLLLSCIAMAVAAIVENVRRKTALEEGISEDPSAIVNMSALWLMPQLCLLGLAEGINVVGQIEFYYSQLPKSMTSLAMAIFTLGTAFSGLLGSLVINVVNRVTSNGGKISWLASNINKGHYDYYYGILCFLSLLNLLYFLVCIPFLGISEEKRVKISKGTGELEETFLSKSTSV